jgi:hypothetical protein
MVRLQSLTLTTSGAVEGFSANGEFQRTAKRALALSGSAARRSCASPISAIKHVLALSASAALRSAPAPDLRDIPCGHGGVLLRPFMSIERRGAM